MILVMHSVVLNWVMLKDVV